MSLLCFKDWIETNVVEEKTHYFITANYEPTAYPVCPDCGSNALQKYGLRERVIKDSPVRGKPVTIFLTLQRYRCTNCLKIFCRDTPPQLVGNSRLTKRLIVYIITQSVKKNFYEVSYEVGVSESTVRDIFTAFVEKSQEILTLDPPRIMGVDDVYISRVARCIITDIENKRVIDILPKKDTATINSHFYRMKDREKVEAITIDMTRTFYDSVLDAFCNAKVIIDTFHVQRYCSKAIMYFLDDLKNRLNLSQRRILIKDRFLLLHRYYNLDDEQKAKLNDWKSKLEPLAEVYDLKEEFYSIWQLKNREAAELKYQSWKKKMSPTADKAFYELTNMIENWYEPIFNYFDLRYTNAFTESCNSIIKRMQSEGRGYEFETLRSKMLFRYSLDWICEEIIFSEGSLARNSSTGKSNIKRLETLRQSQNRFRIPNEE